MFKDNTESALIGYVGVLENLQNESKGRKLKLYNGMSATKLYFWVPLTLDC